MPKVFSKILHVAVLSLNNRRNLLRQDYQGSVAPWSLENGFLRFRGTVQQISLSVCLLSLSLPHSLYSLWLHIVTLGRKSTGKVDLGVGGASVHVYTYIHR